MNLNIENFFKNKGKNNIIIVGLGYVGLPLLMTFNKKYNVIGFDLNKERIEELKNNYDRTEQISEEELKKANIKFSNDPSILKKGKIFIITVPTPITKETNPDLSYIKGASELVGSYISKKSLIIYESTVYPGVTEEICVPIIEKSSNLKWKKDFWVGYSPERISPGDMNNVEKIKKVVSGDTPETAEFLKILYSNVITRGIYKAESIKTAEAVKLTENIQRDVNIALMNELAIIYSKMGINIHNVIEAASTKWNFIKIYPGLVGGHCIAVDPYYLIYRSRQFNYEPKIINAARVINEEIPEFIAKQAIKLILSHKDKKLNKRILILGFTYKENIKDTRNTKVYELYRILQEYGFNIDIFDPMVIEKEVEKEYNIKVETKEENIINNKYDALIIAVKHNYFKKFYNKKSIKKLIGKNGIIIDIKAVLKNKNFIKYFIYWNF